MAAKLGDATSGYMSGSGDIASAKALAGTDKKELLALVDALAAAGKRAHLETLGEAGLGKDVKKAARKAAYKLKSAGVEGEGQRESVDLAVEVDLEHLALLSAPGLRGQGWLAVADFAGFDGLEATFAANAELEKIRQLEGVTAGRLKKSLRNVIEEDPSARSALPFLGGGDIAVRMCRRWREDSELGGHPLPASWDLVETWCQRVIEAGADPERASARAQLGDAAQELDINLQRTTEKLLDVPEMGVMWPPEDPLAAMFDQIGEATHSDLELTEAQFRERLEGIAHSACDAWLADEATRKAVAHRMETCADAMLSLGKRDEAAQALWISDQLAGGDLLPHEIGVLQAAFQRLVSFDAAWEHYRDYLEHGDDHAHHHHGHHHHHDHDHDHD